MKERPILMNAPMVRAVLDGRKTQTRRIVKPQPIGNHREKFKFSTFTDDEGIETYWQNYPLWGPVRSPYGQIGDRLWVRENYKVALHSPGHNNGLQESGGIDSEQGVATIAYAAGGDMVTVDFLEEHEDAQAARALAKLCPSIHMPRWASRILLEITNVRVERLNDISETDAQVEGVERRIIGEGWREYGLDKQTEAYGTPPLISAKESFHSLWESINGPGSWYVNPWVWAIEFKVVK